MRLNQYFTVLRFLHPFPFSFPFFSPHFTAYSTLVGPKNIFIFTHHFDLNSVKRYPPAVLQFKFGHSEKVEF